MPEDTTSPGRWPVGAEEIEEMIADGTLQQGIQAEPFDRMRRRRNSSEYDLDSEVHPEDVDDDLPKARAIVEKVRTWAARLGPF